MKLTELALYEWKLDAAKRAWSLIHQGPDDAVIWDSETTAIKGAKFVQIAAIDMRGNVLFDQLIDPQIPIPMDAQEIHHISDDMVVGQKNFMQVMPELRRVLHDKPWIIYNVGFDERVMDAEQYAAIHWADAEAIQAYKTFCAMNLYAEFWGQWNERYGNFTWQKLTAACERHGIVVYVPAHNALGDCFRTLKLLQHMAKWYEKQESFNVYFTY